MILIRPGDRLLRHSTRGNHEIIIGGKMTANFLLHLFPSKIDCKLKVNRFTISHRIEVKFIGATS